MKKIISSIIVIGTLLLASSFLNFRSNSNLQQSVSNINWDVCESTGSNYFQVTSIKVIGDLSIGSNLRMEIYGNVKQPFTHAFSYVTTKIKYLIPVTVVDKTFPINPPVAYAVGANMIASDNKIDQSIPNASFESLIRLQDPASKKLQCIKVTYTVTAK